MCSSPEVQPYLCNCSLLSSHHTFYEIMLTHRALSSKINSSTEQFPCSPFYALLYNSKIAVTNHLPHFILLKNGRWPWALVSIHTCKKARSIMQAEEKCQQDVIYRQWIPQIQNSHKCKTKLKVSCFLHSLFVCFYLKHKKEQDKTNQSCLTF